MLLEIAKLNEDNPYSPPAVDSPLAPDPATVRLASVARAFRWLGWLVSIVYGPIVIVCIVALVLSSLGRHDESPAFMLLVCMINGAVFALGVSLIRTARRVAARDHTVRMTAMAISCILMLGFPLFTIVGVICFRHIRQYLVLPPSDVR